MDQTGLCDLSESWKCRISAGLHSGQSFGVERAVLKSEQLTQTLIQIINAGGSQLMVGYSIQNKQAWEYNAYEFWVSQYEHPSWTNSKMPGEFTIIADKF